MLFIDKSWNHLRQYHVLFQLSTGSAYIFQCYFNDNLTNRYNYALFFEKKIRLIERFVHRRNYVTSTLILLTYFELGAMSDRSHGNKIYIYIYILSLIGERADDQHIMFIVIKASYQLKSHNVTVFDKFKFNRTSQIQLIKLKKNEHVDICTKKLH